MRIYEPDEKEKKELRTSNLAAVIRQALAEQGGEEFVLQIPLVKEDTDDREV